MICVSIGRTRHRMVVLEHRALAEKGAELVELRLDWLSRQPDLPRLLRDRPTPSVVTCRRQSDRGRWRWSEEQRLAVLRAAIVEGVEYIDLERDIAGSIPRYGNTRRIVSHHDFDQTPSNLTEIHAEMCELDPDIVKIVTMANSPSDVVRMLQLVASAEVPTVGFCMGELGLASRILCGKYGSPFTYASFSSERELAPGQISFSEMKHLYRFDDIDEETQVYGVLGDPIAHSYSPLIHNAVFRKTGRNAVYIPFRVPKDALKPTLRDFEWLKIRGYSVTIPHKEAVLKWASSRSELAEAIGAANTLFRMAGEWRADNTDCPAALSCLREVLEDHPHLDEELAGKHVLILGAGGVARAIGYGLLQAGADVIFTNRHHDRARSLASALGCRQIQWENRATEYCDILINCTPLGMHPALIDQTPYEANWMRDDLVVFDTVYNPENTLLLKEARRRGCPTVSGLEMFVRQAALQYELFTGETAPLEIIREALRRAISPVNY